MEIAIDGGRYLSKFAICTELRPGINIAEIGNSVCSNKNTPGFLTACLSTSLLTHLLTSLLTSLLISLLISISTHIAHRGALYRAVALGR